MAATQPTKLGIYHPLPGKPNSHYLRVAEVLLDGAGRVQLRHIVDASDVCAALDRIIDAVGLRRLDRRVSPDEGPLYLEALKETLERSTYWRLVDESADEGRAVLIAMTQLASDADQLNALANAAGLKGMLLDRLKAHSQIAAQLRDDLQEVLGGGVGPLSV